MPSFRPRLAALVAAFVSAASAANADPGARVLILSSGDSGLDGHAELVLESHGHVADVGPAYWELSDWETIAAYDVVYLQANANWNDGDMPEDGQRALVTFIRNGGGLLTSEWVTWEAARHDDFAILSPLFAVNPSTAFSNHPAATYRRAAPNTVVTSLLPESFTFQLSSFGGTENTLVPRTGATIFFSSDGMAQGVVGISRGAGRVINLSVCAGTNSLSDQNFQRLMGNCVDWLNTGGPRCPADYNRDGAVSSQDFFDFLAAFFSASPEADMNGDSFVDSRDLFDYLTLFFVGCQ
jgi:hypothetical protein